MSDWPVFMNYLCLAGGFWFFHSAFEAHRTARKHVREVRTACLDIYAHCMTHYQNFYQNTEFHFDHFRVFVATNGDFYATVYRNNTYTTFILDTPANIHDLLISNLRSVQP